MNKNYQNFFINIVALKILLLIMEYAIRRSGCPNVPISFEIKLFMIYFLRKVKEKERKKQVRSRNSKI